MPNNFFRHTVTTNTNVLGTGRYHDGIKAMKVDSGILTMGGWDGLNSPNFSYNDQHSSNDYFATVNVLANAPWVVRHSYGLDTLSSGHGRLFGSDKQPAATPTNRKEYWHIDKTTLAHSLLNNNLPTGDRVLSGFNIRKTTDEGFVFGGQGGYNISDGLFGDIYKIAADGLSAVQVMTGVTILQGNNDGHTCYDPDRDIFHLVCTGGKYDGVAANKTYPQEHWTYDPNANTLSHIGNFPGKGRQYGNLVWNPFDHCLYFMGGFVGPTSTENVDEIWYWNGNDWAKIRAKTPGPCHASANCYDAEKDLHDHG
jgi:hypothetical protein